jgi:hypothetical protein
MRVKGLALVAGIAGLLAALSVGAVLAAPRSQVGPEVANTKVAVEQHGYLGITLAPLIDSVREALEIPEDVSGLVVRRVNPEGPAAVAGIERGSILTVINNLSLTSTQPVRAALKGLVPGDIVTLTLYSDGALVDVAVTLGEASDRAGHQQHRPQVPHWLTQTQQLRNAYPNLLSGELRMVNDEGDVVTFNVTPGQVITAGNDTLTIQKRDESEATFTLNEESIVPQKGERVELDALETGSRVVVLEQDGEVTAVIAGPFGNHRQGKQVNGRHFDASPPLPPEVQGHLRRIEGTLQKRFTNQASRLPGMQRHIEGLEHPMRGLRERLGRLEQRGDTGPVGSATNDQQA